MDIGHNVKLKKSVVSAIITRADGTIEDLGVIHEQDHNQTWLEKIKSLIKKVFNG